MKPKTLAGIIIIILIIALLGLGAYYYLYLEGRGGGIVTKGAEKPPPGIEVLFTIYGPGTGEIQLFTRPLGVGTDNQGNLYVADTGNNRVVVFDRNGRYKFMFGRKGVALPPPGEEATWKGGLFNFPYGIDTDKEGNIYVGDLFNHRVQVFDSSGKYLYYFPKEQSLDPESKAHQTFLYPLNLDIKEDKVYVASSFLIDIYSLKGKKVGSIGDMRIGRGKGQLDHPNGVAVGSDDTVFVSDSANTRIQAFDSEGKVKWVQGKPAKGITDLTSRQFGLPRGMDIDANGNIFIADAFHYTIQVYNSKGKKLAEVGEDGTKEGYFNLPNDIAIRPDGVIYVADKENHRVQAIRITGIPGVSGKGIVGPQENLLIWVGAILLGLILIIIIVLIVSRIRQNREISE